jgi:hypothetical protein
MQELDEVHIMLRQLAGETRADDSPAYLFRGERNVNPQTLSSLDRIYHDPDLPAEIYDELDNLTAYCMQVPLRSRHLEPTLAGAFAQHYGLPTQVFDFTASPEVAINFAANRPRHRPAAAMGLVGILDVEAAERSGRVALFDLRDLSDAERPRRQEAFGLIYSGFVPDDFTDLKRSELADGIGLRWIQFAHLFDDETYLHLVGADQDLENAEGDDAARLPLQFVEQFVEARGPLSQSTARYLAAAIIPQNERAARVGLWSRA